MKKNNIFILFFGLGLFFHIAGPCSSPLFGEQESWLNNSLNVSLNPRFTLILTQEMRSYEFTYADPYMFNLQGGISAKLNRRFYAAFLYKREHVSQPAESNENRYTFEAGWKTGLARKISFDLRARAELRRYDISAQDHTRYRFRLRLIYNGSLGQFQIRPFIAAETFGKDDIFSVQKNRLYIGSYIPITRNLEITLNYIWLNEKDQEDTHIVNSGFSLKF